MTEVERERDEARALAGALSRELERWKRGQLVEGDYICENGDVVGDPYAERDRARAEVERLRAEAERERAAAVEHLRALAGDDRFPWTESERDHALRSAADDIEAGEHREGR